MAAPKRTTLKREEDLAEIARLDAFGYSLRQIGAKLGLHHSTIERDIATLTERHKKKQLVNRDEGVNRQIVALRAIRNEAYEAWERSKEDITRETKESVRRMVDPKKQSEQNTKDSVEKLKELTVTEGRLPGNEYLTTILKTFHEEAELLGLYAPKRLNHAGADGEPFKVYLNFSPDEV